MSEFVDFFRVFSTMRYSGQMIPHFFSLVSVRQLLCCSVAKELNLLSFTSETSATTPWKPDVEASKGILDELDLKRKGKQ